ncbi:hypothetical protein HUT03_05135 [Candidatus Liberibacter africanus]|uniref:hypothetical protein n=1 Tax=Liberibacter africanus TaxID=34020 RepID=UPI0006413E47|nr:hypothetical protein [Candidatus Liberibacter africanus]QTP64305.1 hypothetical protein HUT03_05135 [Candidatus Liberibacter africanus]
MFFLQYYQREKIFFGIIFSFKYYFFVFTPCRKCESCLKNRGLFWLHRCQTEVIRSTRTWFISLTFTAKKHTIDYATSIGEFVDDSPDTRY